MTTYDDTFEREPSIQVLAERQRGLLRSVGDLLKWRGGRDGIDAWRGITDERLQALSEDIKTVKRMLWGLIFTSLAGFGSVAIAVYLSTGKPHP